MPTKIEDEMLDFFKHLVETYPLGVKVDLQLVKRSTIRGRACGCAIMPYVLSEPATIKVATDTATWRKLSVLGHEYAHLVFYYIENRKGARSTYTSDGLENAATDWGNAALKAYHEGTYPIPCRSKRIEPAPPPLPNLTAGVQADILSFLTKQAA